MEADGSGGAGRELIRPAAATATATAEDEAAKRNTDCVYFLASPLTCKKGSECEYRHSEGARMNPRDCWYWLNGNCLNPKCSFRHPPLDGLYGPPGITTSGPSQPPTQTVSSMQIPGTHASGYNLNKQSVPCYYFQKGGCLKGDKCPFMHVPQTIGNPGPQATTNSIPQQGAKVPASASDQSQTLKKDSWGLKECTIQQPKVSLEKPTEVLPLSAKPAINAEALSNNGLLHKKSSSPFPVDNELPKSQPPYVPLSGNDAANVPPNRQLRLTDEHLQYGHEADEFLPESSPGFDVLVDDNSEDPDYFHNKDDYGHGGRNVNPVNDFDYHHPDYDLIPQFERDRYNGMGEHERDGRVHSHHGWEQRWRSSERVLDRQSMYDRRALEREETVNEIDGLDLRHQLLKQRRMNGPRSAISPERRREPYHRDDRSAEDRHRGRSSNRDQRQYPHESSISSRLRGRITLPRRSSPDTPVDFRSEKERDRGRHRGRLSPARPINNHDGRHHDRIRRRTNEEVTADVRNSGRQLIKRDDAESLDFAGPKSLAELKGAKNAESFQDQQPRKDQGNMKPAKVIGSQESEGSFTFEGPKPLSVILKRKRETTDGNGALSGGGDENRKKYRDITISSVSVVASSVHLTRSAEACKVDTHEEEEEEGLIPTGAEELHDDSHSAMKDELEDLLVETMEDRDLENDNQRDGESDYEGGDFRTEDDENMHQDDEDFDDEDDFARKVGMILS